MITNANSARIPLKDRSVHVMVTSPPYWGLRDYGLEPTYWPAVEYAPLTGLPPVQIEPMVCALGLEPTLDAYIGHLVTVFREGRRVLRDDGTLWLNLGDSFAASGGNLPSKNLVGVPWRVALALQADGWYLRSAVPWVKRNGMPGSQQDRPTAVIETIFLLAKSERYYYDQEAVKVPTADSTVSRNRRGVGNHKSVDGAPGQTAHSMHQPRAYDPDRQTDPLRIRRDTDWFFESWQGMLTDDGGDPLAFVVNTKGYKGAHFATWPPDLVLPMILASTSEYGVCPDCGAPWERNIEKPDMADRPTRSMASKTESTEVHISNNWANHPKSAGQAYQNWRNANPDRTTGWQPACTCHLTSHDLQPDDLEIISSPTGQRSGDDPTLEIGRSGYGRPRGENEGQRPITRFEQRAYASQLKKSPDQSEMKAQAGTAFDHCIRTDRSGARPIPEKLLRRWLELGWLQPVTVPQAEPDQPDQPVKAVVLDPFAGSGTTGEVCRLTGRDFVGLDLNPEYLAHHALPRAEKKTSQAALDELPLFQALNGQK